MQIFHIQSTYDHGQHHPIPLVRSVVIISLLVLILVFPIYLLSFLLLCYLIFFLLISCSTLLLPLLPSLYHAHHGAEKS